MISPQIRQNTFDDDIFRSIVDLNEYRIPDDLTNFRIYDIGGHIGSFSWLCASRKAKEIFYCEPSKENFEIGKEWITNPLIHKQFNGTNYFLCNYAVWKKDKIKSLTFRKPDNINTGDGTVFINKEDNNVEEIRIFPFEDLTTIKISEPDAKYSLLKLNCEGSEFPILLTNDLKSIDHICGEFHEMYKNIPTTAIVQGYDNYDVYTLQNILLEKGFKYTYFKRSRNENNQSTNLGRFWASKTNKKFFKEVPLTSYKQNNI